MAGEMSQDEVTREAYPHHFAVADEFDGTVRAFDQYRGPYVHTPYNGTFWLMPETFNATSWDGSRVIETTGHVYWYNDWTGLTSSCFHWNAGAEECVAAAREALSVHERKKNE